MRMVRRNSVFQRKNAGVLRAHATIEQQRCLVFAERIVTVNVNVD
jgi:hypothetical protein